MTTKGKLIEILMGRGFSAEQAELIMELAIPVLNTEYFHTAGYQITFDSPSDGYPDMMYAMWFELVVKPIAYKWICDNKPKAWFKPMFSPLFSDETYNFNMLNMPS